MSGASAFVTDARDDRRLTTRRLAPVLLLAGAAFLICFALHEWLYPHLSGDADEGAYVLAAKMLQSHKLTLPADEWGAFFRPWLSAEVDGQIFPPYLPAWPAVLAVADWLTGSMAVAPAATAAAWVLVTYLLAIELFDDRRTGLLSAALMTVTPLVVFHGALLLSYAFSAVTLTFGGAALLRGHRTGRAAWLLVAGAAMGVGLLNRSFDAVVISLPFVAYVALRGRREPARLLRSFALAAAGALPFVLIFLGYNAAVTGDPTLPPIAATDPTNTIGFGDRRMIPDFELMHYDFRVAYESFRDNLEALPSWLPGGVVLVVLALVGAILRPRRPERLLLVGLVVIVPVAHLYWWGTALSVEGATNGIGLHYYLAMVTPLVILASVAITSLRWQSRWLPVAAVALLALLTVPAIDNKLDVQRYVNGVYERALAAIPGDLPEPAVMIVRNDADLRYVGGQLQFLANGPDLNKPILYAAPIGPAEHRLADVVPGRRIFRLNQRESDEPNIYTPPGKVVELETIRGPRVTVHAEITNERGTRTVRAYAGDQSIVLDTDSSKGRTYEVDWILSATETGPGIVTVDHDQFVVIGVALSQSDDPADTVLWEQRISSGPVNGDVQVQMPGYPWFGLPVEGDHAWLPRPVDRAIELTAAAS